MDSNNKGTEGYSLFAALLQRRSLKKQLRKLAAENERQRGIIRYQPGHIEAFFDMKHEIGNILVSGDNIELRNHAVNAQAICAYNQGIPTVILHENDVELENVIRSTFAVNNAVITFSKNYPYYDPFKGLSSKEISSLILNAFTGISDISLAGSYYIDAMIDIISKKAVYPYCRMFMTCPFDRLLEKAETLMMRDIITEHEYNKISSLLMQGQSERANIENFFKRLNSEAGFLIAEKRNLQNAYSIIQIIKQKCVTMIDIQSMQNDVLLNIVLSEIALALRNGEKLLLVIDSMSLEQNTMLSKFVNYNSYRCKKMLVGNDVYSMINSDDRMLSNYMANCDMAIIGAHKSLITCEKWSGYIGKYEKREVSANLGGHSSFHNGYGYGSNFSYNVTTKREDVLSPEELHNMSYDEVVVLNQKRNELAYMQLS